MPQFDLRYKLQVLLVLALALALAPWSVLAQSPDPPEPAIRPPLTKEALEELRKKAADAADLDAETKKQIESQVQDALSSLSKIDEAVRDAEQFKADADTTEKRVAALRDELRQLEQYKESRDYSDLGLAELNQEVASREADLALLKAAEAKALAAATDRAARRREIRSLLLSARGRIAEIDEALEAAAPANESPLLTTARQAALEATKRLVEAEQPALQNELAKFDKEDPEGFLRAVADVERQKAINATNELKILKGLLVQRRAADTAAAVRRAESELKATPAALKPAAQVNLEFARAADALSQPLAETRLELDRASERLDGLLKQFSSTEKRVKEVGLTGSIGALLRKQRELLPDVRTRRMNVRARRGKIEEAQETSFDLEDRRSQSLEATKKEILETVGPEAVTLYSATAELIAERRREYLDSATQIYDSYVDRLFDLDATERKLIRETEKYQDYIDERVLWIKSNRLIFSSPLETPAPEFFNLNDWGALGQQYIGDIKANWLLHLAFTIAFFYLIWRKSYIQREIENLGQTAARGSCAAFSPTARAALLTALLTLIWPALVLFIGWRIRESGVTLLLAQVVSEVLYLMGWVYLPIELLRRVCCRQGLAESHFNWSPSSIEVLRDNLKWALWVSLFIVISETELVGRETEHSGETLKRLMFALGSVAAAHLLWRILNPTKGAFRDYLTAHPDGWLFRLQSFWYWGAVATPLGLAALAIIGYYYTAEQLTGRLYESLALIVVVKLIGALLSRMLLMRRRTIHIEQAQERRARAAEEHDPEEGSATEGIIPAEELAPDIAGNTEKTQRLIYTLVLATSLLGLWSIWGDVLPALRILDQWTLWHTTIALDETPSESTPLTPGAVSGDVGSATAGRVKETLVPVSVADLALAIVIALVTIACMRNVPGLMEMSVLQRLPLDNSMRYAITAVTSYGIGLVGTILAFQAISVGWSQVQWLAAALTFGLAFGLQELFANFIAGLILLFEQPIRVGDVVTVDNVTGVVSRIRIRATTITDYDRKEYLIPNKEFITGRILNWTLYDKTNRIVINIGVAYGSDVARAKKLLLEVCQDHPLILDDPASAVTFEGFGDNTLNLVVRTFLPNLDNRLSVIDDLHTNIDRVFRDAGIEIAFPQRDLHIRSVEAEVLERLGRSAETPSRPVEPRNPNGS